MKTREELEARIAKREIKTAKLKQQLKPVDGWYINTSLSNEGVFFYMDCGVVKFGIEGNGRWRIDYPSFYYTSGCDILATPSEVTERLTKFVNGLGYKEGVTVRGVFYNDNAKVLTNKSLNFSPIDDRRAYVITLGGWAIWDSEYGWAKIVGQKPKYKVTPKEFGIKDDDIYKLNLDVSIGTLNYIDGSSLAKLIEDYLNSDTE